MNYGELESAYKQAMTGAGEPDVMCMKVVRAITDIDLEYSRFPASLIMNTVNHARSLFAPVEKLDTRIFRSPGFQGIFIEVKLPEKSI